MALDEARARAWLTGPDGHTGDESVLAYVGIEFDDWGYEDPDWHWTVDRLVTEASQTDLLPEGTMLILHADGEGSIDGAFITRDLANPHIRLCSLHQDWRDLTDDREATGIDAALAVLRTVYDTASRLELPVPSVDEIWDQRRIDAARTLAQTFGVYRTWADIAPNLACGEADALAEFLAAFSVVTADVVLNVHRDGDDEGDAHYRLDTETGASRQHYIDTGHYMREDGTCVCDDARDETAGGPWRTLAAEGVTQSFPTREAAEQHATVVAAQTNAVVDIEFWSPEHPQDELNRGWGTVGAIYPPGQSAPPPRDLHGEVCEHCSRERRRGHAQHRPCSFYNCGCDHGEGSEQDG